MGKTNNTLLLYIPNRFTKSRLEKLLCAYQLFDLFRRILGDSKEIYALQKRCFIIN